MARHKNKPKDLYKVLGVDRGVSADEIKLAYRKMVMKYHPDRAPGDAKAAAKFKEIQEAWETLGDPDKRKMYDETGVSSHKEPRNLDPGVVGLLQTALEIVLNAVIQSGKRFNKADLAKLMVSTLQVSKGDAVNNANELGKMLLEIDRWEDVKRRFKDANEENVLEPMLDAKIRAVKISIEAHHNHQRVHDLALGYLAKVKYEIDPDMWASGGSGTVSINGQPVAQLRNWTAF